MRTVNVQDAKVQTVTIEVKHLLVGGNKLTLAGFRQIPKEAIINFDNAKLEGIPWGTINYFWKGEEKNYDNTIHILWQKEDSLRRSIVNKFADIFINSYKKVCKFPEGHIQVHTSFESIQYKKAYNFIIDKDGIISCKLDNQADFIQSYGTLPQLPVLDFSKYHKLKEPNPPFEVMFTPERDQWEKTNPEYIAWKKLKEEGTDKFQEYIREVYKVVSSAAKVAYSVYVNNYLNICNNLVKELRELDQIYIAT